MDVNQDRGLSPGEVDRSGKHFGDNRMTERGPTSLWKLLWESVNSPMMLALLAIA